VKFDFSLAFTNIIIPFVHFYLKHYTILKDFYKQFFIPTNPTTWVILPVVGFVAFNTAKLRTQNL